MNRDIILQVGPSTFDEATIVHVEFRRAVQGVMIEHGESQLIAMRSVREWMGHMVLANLFILEKQRRLRLAPIVTFAPTHQELAAVMDGSAALPKGFR